MFDAVGNRLEGTNYLALLYAGSRQDSLQLLFPATPFQTGALAGYFNGGAREVPGVLPLTRAWVEVRAWDARLGATFEEVKAQGVGGYGDYTPLHFGARRGDTTWAHQVATAAIFNQPLLTYGAHPTNLLNSPCLAMIKSIPSAWDETIVLPISEIGELAVFARRSEERWFLAILNGPTARTIQVPLSLLGNGRYQALLVRDQAKEAATLKIEDLTVSRADSLTIDLRSGGGFIARFIAGAE